MNYKDNFFFILKVWVVFCFIFTTVDPLNEGTEPDPNFHYSASSTRHIVADDAKGDHVVQQATLETRTSKALPEMLQDARTFNHSAKKTDYVGNHLCSNDRECSELGGDCIFCYFNYSCVYGENIDIKCKVNADVSCQGQREFQRKMVCQYCYQSNPSDYHCLNSTSCRVNSAPRQTYISRCTVFDHVLCLGKREFNKKLLCNFTKGYSWSTTLFLSIVLGGFGVDRFYLGMWQEGIGKLFSFGGLGVWTLVDVILISTGYLGPADGSLYIA